MNFERMLIIKLNKYPALNFFRYIEVKHSLSLSLSLSVCFSTIKVTALDSHPGSQTAFEWRGGHSYGTSDPAGVIPRGAQFEQACHTMLPLKLLSTFRGKGEPGVE